MDERIGFRLYPSCGNRGSVGRVSVSLFGLCDVRCVCGVGSGFEPGSGEVR